MSHFESKKNLEVGARENCCDNCDRRMKAQAARAGNKENSQTNDDEEVNYGKEARDFLQAINVS